TRAPCGWSHGSFSCRSCFNPRHPSKSASGGPVDHKRQYRQLQVWPLILGVAMGHMDYGGLPVLAGCLFILPRDEDAGGMEVGEGPEQLKYQGDSEGNRAERILTGR